MTSPKFNQTSNVDELDDDIEIESAVKSVHFAAGESKTLWRRLATAVLCFLALTTTIIVFAFLHHSEADSQQHVHQTEDLVQAIIEEPAECLLDDNCHSFQFNLSADSNIRRMFNAYDGDNDDMWSKDEFMLFYVESVEGAAKGHMFDTMDLTGDGVWSYKEAVVYYMIMSDVPSARDRMYPLVSSVVADVYGYNSTSYRDQLLWEYVAELSFMTFDEFREGLVNRDDYLQTAAEIAFDTFAKSDATHHMISFDEFMESRFSEESLNVFVNTNITALTSEYNDFAHSILNATYVSELLSSLELKHCIYSAMDSARRRLVSLQEQCITQVAGCTFASIATAAGCVASIGTGGWAIVACAAGAGATGTACFAAARTCQEFLDLK